MKKRNAEMSGPGTLGSIALVMLIVAVLLFIFRGPAEAADFAGTAPIVKSSYDLCESKATQMINRGETPAVDSDKDGFPDNCDNCIKSDGKSNSYEDSDEDGMPDDCDDDVDNPTVFKCKKGISWDSKSKRQGKCIE